MTSTFQRHGYVYLICALVDCAHLDTVLRIYKRGANFYCFAESYKRGVGTRGAQV